MWRHNSILQAIIKLMKPGEANFNTCVDLQHFCQGVSTINPDIVPTAQSPDLVFVNYSCWLLIILELSMSFELNTDATYDCKVCRYAGLLSNIEACSFSVEYYQLEIGSRCFVSQDTVNHIKKLCKSIKSEAKISHLTT